MRTFSWALALFFLATAAFAGDSSSPDKDQYTLLNPTPGALLRDIPTATFDKTPDPFTVDAGHFQVNLLMDYYYDSESFSFPFGSAKASASTFHWYPAFAVGLLNNVDFQITPSFWTTTERGNGTFVSPFGGTSTFNYKSTSTEWGDVNMAFTINLWGNDGGTTALGLIPSVSVPTNGADPAGGLTVPFALRLPNQVMVKLSTGIATDGSSAEFANHLAVEKAFGKSTIVFCNMDGFVTTNSSQDWWGYAGFGAAYKITNDLQVYAAMRFGFEGGDEYNPYIGITWRY